MDSRQTLAFYEVGMPRLLSVNVGLPRAVIQPSLQMTKKRRYENEQS